jgi:methyl-accepting chemotaxis protein
VKLGNEEQARGIEQIAKGITQMEQVTQSTAAQAEESAAASSDLSRQAQAIGLVVLRLLRVGRR